jgi:hypothetical protein
MRKLMITILVLSGISHANASYFWATLETGSIDVDGSTADLSGFGLGYTGGVGNFYASTEGLFSTIDIDGFEFDANGTGITFGYSFTDLAEGGVILGLTYADATVSGYGISVNDSETRASLSYGKFSGEGLDYVIGLSEGTVSGGGFYSFTDSLTFVFTTSFDEDGSNVGIGLGYKF